MKRAQEWLDHLENRDEDSKSFDDELAIVAFIDVYHSLQDDGVVFDEGLVEQLFDDIKELEENSYQVNCYDETLEKYMESEDLGAIAQLSVSQDCDIPRFFSDEREIEDYAEESYPEVFEAINNSSCDYISFDYDDFKSENFTEMISKDGQFFGYVEDETVDGLSYQTVEDFKSDFCRHNEQLIEKLKLEASIAEASEVDSVESFLTRPETGALFESMLQYDGLHEDLEGKDRELFSAVSDHSVKEVQEAINEGANVNCRGKFGLTPLMKIATGLDVEFTDEMIEAMSSGKSIADFGNDIEVEKAKVLLEAGADVTLVDDAYKSAIDHMANSNNTDLKALLTSAMEKAKLEGATVQKQAKPKIKL